MNRGFKKIDPEKLKSYIIEHPDVYQREIVEVFECSSVAVGKALKRPGIAHKKVLRYCEQKEEQIK
ncbi:MAG: IS630 transposase-related protein [Ruminococcus sp.]|nr:IS630 transposase-related protein [Ruminococcus sp.]